MDQLNIEVLHRSRTSVGMIGEGDSDIQFVTFLLVKSGIDVAVHQIASRDAIRFYHCEDYSVHVFLTNTSDVRGWLFHFQTFGLCTRRPYFTDGKGRGLKVRALHSLRRISNARNCSVRLS